MARRCLWRGLALSMLGGVVFVGSIVALVLLEEQADAPPEALMAVLSFVPPAVIVLCLFAAWRAFSARGLLRADARGGVVSVFRGHLEEPASISHAWKRLVAMGLLDSDAEREQTLEALPVSRRVWRVNDRAPGRTIIAESWGHPADARRQRQSSGFSLGFSAAILAWYVTWKLIPADAPARYLLGFALMVFGFYSATAVHEIGHLIAGRLAGLRFVLVNVGPVQVARTVRGPRLRRNRLGNVGGGLAMCVPDRPDGYASRMLLFIAGGPAAGILIGGGAIAWAWLRDGLAFTVSPGWTGALLMWGTATLVFTGLLPLLPSSVAGGFASDGANIRLFRRGGPAVRRAAAAASLLGQGIGGIRPALWEPEWVEEACAAVDGRPAPGVRILAYYHAMDLGDMGTARVWLDALRDELPAATPLMRSVLSMEDAYLTARAGGDAAGARSLLDAVDRRLVDRHNLMRADAAVLLAEGRPREAAASARAGIAALGMAESEGFATASRDWLNDLLTACSDGVV